MSSMDDKSGYDHIYLSEQSKNILDCSLEDGL